DKSLPRAGTQSTFSAAGRGGGATRQKTPGGIPTANPVLAVARCLGLIFKSSIEQTSSPAASTLPRPGNTARSSSCLKRSTSNVLVICKLLCNRQCLKILGSVSVLDWKWRRATADPLDRAI